MSLPGDLEPPGPPDPTMKTLVDVEPRIPIYADDLPLTITEPGSYYFAEDIETLGQGIRIEVDHVTIDLMGHTLTGGAGTGIESISNKVTVKNGIVHFWSSHGIHLSEESSVSRVRSCDNGGMGIRMGSLSTVSASVATSNASDGISIMRGHVRNCLASGNQGNGIFARYESLIIDCVANTNHLNGIRVDADTTVRGNHCGQNGLLEPKAGIFVFGAGNRIDGNTLFANDYGIRVEGSENTVHRNAATGNSAGDYWFVTGNDVGPIGPSSTATSPWANITY
jgi:parallel beta-helix repeat protein